MEKIYISEVKNPQKLMMEDYLCVKVDAGWKLTIGRGECRTGGYDVKLKEAMMDDGVLTVVVSFKNPDPKGFVTMVITYPTREYLLELSQEIKSVIFQRENGDVLKVIHI